ncbi:phosphatidylserine/phosphatidylglycerophosphate/cardiolipin synthase family protein [Pseudenhygromyxa sp. WMMC2535]|uniref:phospholipase D-like domain-containing protein n=1 Tax=Pseudenhygromyxa sp. WMMC2535 TaxID=2712867 RepID=UPI0015548C90|nr:phosphatidylserine/phosphatidylglycerophosphate/cardiolipin synthase family protein [Pseudenhygromyxa sp. WMMC2535]NVB36765.1 phosphatidylserine/phosphatidylglycerophosphate/cardiolipin synthase family protein [Pseudenhygromyxa sp. WMMC2535]
MRERPEPNRGSLRRAIRAFLDSQSERDPEEPGQLVEVAARALGPTLERWSRSPGLRRLIGGVERDVLTRPGEWVELEAKLGVAGKFGGRARFTLAGEAVAEIELEARGEVRAMIRAPAPGSYAIAVELVRDDAQRPAELIGRRTLQVADARPMALIDAELLLREAPPAPALAEPSAHALISALNDAGLAIAVFDLHLEDRSAALHEAMAQLGLGMAAALRYSTDQQDLERLGVDVDQLFAQRAVRKLQAKGVAIAAVVSPRAWPAGLVAEVDFLSPEQVLAHAHGQGFRAAHERARAFVAARERADPLTWRLDRATASTLVAHNAVHAELDNRRARERLFELIAAARESVHLQFYILRPSEFLERLIVALIHRARAGVRVRLMIDALYSEEELLGRLNPLLHSLRAEANIELLAVERIESAQDVELTRLKRRDHRKLVIVDGLRALVSGRNASDEYYQGFDEVPIHDNTRHERIPWLDAHVEVAGPLVREIQANFLETWRDQGGSLPRGLGPESLPELEPAGEVAARLVVHRGLADANGMAMYEALLELAEDHVIIVNDFPIVSTLERAILCLLARGVRVELLTGSAAARRADGSFFPAPLHRTLFEHMVKARLEPLLLAGVAIYEFQPPPSPLNVARGGRVRPYVHAKIVSVDGRVASVGSANLDATASFWESEANVVIEDENFCRDLEAELREVIAQAVPIDPSSEAWRSERAQRAVVGALWPGSLYS